MKSKLLLLFLIPVLVSCHGKGIGNEEKLYQRHCANCHGTKGEGLKKLIPPLANTDYIKNNRHELACIIRHGLKGNIMVNNEEYSGIMPANYLLSDAEIVNILNYITLQLNAEKKAFSLTEVEKDLQQCN